MINFYGDKLKINEAEIRHQFDENLNEFYYSIVDVINNLELSKDPRNYWKVLKSRLKNTHAELVTECNQLKMKASDGKLYLTDVMLASHLLPIIQIVAPHKVSTFEDFFNQIDRKKLKHQTINLEINKGAQELSTEFLDDGELSVDMFQKDQNLFIKTMIAGVDPKDIFISLNTKTLTIKISRNQNNDDFKFAYQELSWGRFSRIIPLPAEVDIDRVETNFHFGLLTIELCILDKTKTRVIKIKNL